MPGPDRVSQGKEILNDRTVKGQFKILCGRANIKDDDIALYSAGRASPWSQARGSSQDERAWWPGFCPSGTARSSLKEQRGSNFGCKYLEFLDLQGLLLLT